MNRLLLTGIVVLMWIVTGCSNKDQAPAGVLSKEKMEAVLWDIIQAERFTATFVAKDSSKNVREENFKLYSQIFSIHQVTKDEFITSYKFYLSRPDIARVLFDSLSTMANRKREELYKPQTPALADSTKPVQPVQKADSLHARFRDSLLANAKRKKPRISDTQPKLIKPDTVQSTKPKRPIRPDRMRIRDSLLRRP
jgi:hypothetical protein